MTVLRSAQDPAGEVGTQADVTSALNAILSQRRDGDHDQLHQLLTIRQIMTPRSEFRCAVGGETTDAAFARIPFVFDEIPVVEGDDPDDATAKIVGMLRRRDVPHHRYRDKIDDHLDEAPADAPLAPGITILDYARSAANYPVALVGEPGRITGLVTLWDLERLPVRIALFAHIVDFEERMGWLIHESVPDPSAWPSIVTGVRVLQALKEGIRRAAEQDHIGALILAIGFNEKLALLKALLPKSRRSPHSASIVGLSAFRNHVAHGAPFPDVSRIPVHLARIDALIDSIGQPAPFDRIKPRPLR